MVLSNTSSNQDLQSVSSTVTVTKNNDDDTCGKEAMDTLEVTRLQRVGDDAGSFGQVKNRRLQLTRRFSVACLDHPAAEATLQEESTPITAESEHCGYTKQIADRRRRLVRCLSATNLSLTKVSSASNLMSASKSLPLPHLEVDHSSTWADKSVAVIKDRLDASIIDSRHSLLTANSFHSIAEGEESSDDENEDSFALCSKATLMTEDEQEELLIIVSESLQQEPKTISKETTKERKEKRKLKLPVNTRRDGRGESPIENCESSLMALITSDSRHSKTSTRGKSKKKSSKSTGDESRSSSKGTTSCGQRSSDHKKSKRKKGKKSKSSTKGLKQ